MCVCVCVCVCYGAHIGGDLGEGCQSTELLQRLPQRQGGKEEVHHVLLVVAAAQLKEWQVVTGQVTLETVINFNFLFSASGGGGLTYVAWGCGYNYLSQDFHTADSAPHS